MSPTLNLRTWSPHPQFLRRVIVGLVTPGFGLLVLPFFLLYLSLIVQLGWRCDLLTFLTSCHSHLNLTVNERRGGDWTTQI
ncbi:hypothetical protein B0H12DRAFT_1129187 [Mycena haematopus]|nr:hypothetical protein B0H12DRAFT_1129187 [Mycena haematopus]